MYRAGQGWVFLAAPAEREWNALVSAMAEHTDLREDPRFGTASGRRDHDAELAETLSRVFETSTADDWEKRLTAAGVGCVRVTECAPERFIQTDETLAAEYARTARSPLFDDHLRMGPPVRFSRSSTQAKGGCLAGEHTDRILAELGYDAAAITGLRARGAVS
jgi:crotonobetainyl-CoA:carnitine CoA-transferase CaiB-like acyl-CoA transferase